MPGREELTFFGYSVTLYMALYALPKNATTRFATSAYSADGRATRADVLRDSLSGENYEEEGSAYR